ncbi:4Fe-4S binding protein [Patescibacteria group bacterium]|nr:4Fe-4S binding protein [Patescibacteria group bacterium]
MLKKAGQLPIGGIIDEPGSSLKYKTGDWRAFRPIIDEEKCIDCMQCILDCPENCIEMRKDGKRGKVDLDYCKGCGVCAKICPVGAIEMERE